MPRLTHHSKMPVPPKTNGKNGNGKKPPLKGFMLQMNFNLQNLIWWGVVALMILSLVGLWFSGDHAAKEVQLSQALNDIRAGKVDKVNVMAERLELTYKDQKDQTFFSRKEANESFTEILDRAKISPTAVNYEIKDQTFGQIVAQALPSILGTGFIMLVLLYMFRQARGAQDSIFSFGQSRAKLFEKGK